MKMTSLDAPSHPLVEVLTEQFAALIEKGLVDVVLDDSGDTVEVQTDEWTLSLTGWPIRSAFVAIDAITETDAEHRAGLAGALGPRDLAALTAANEAVGDQIALQLRASGDGLSIVLAGMIAGS
jgi:hypothetical protein